MLKAAFRRGFNDNAGLHLNRAINSARSWRPAKLSLILTRRCNLRCEMCQQNRHSPTHKDELPWYDSSLDMPLSAWINVMDQVTNYLPWLSITGGEPLLYPDFKEVVVAAKRRGFAIDLTTNGTMLEKYADFVVEQGIEWLFVSVDGPDFIHEQVRGVQGAFNRTMAGIKAVVEARKRLKSISPIIMLNFTLCQTNLAYIDQMVPIATSLGAELQQFIHPFHNSAANAEKHNRIFSPEFARAHGLNMLAPSLPQGEFYECDFQEQELNLIKKGFDTARKQANGRIDVKFLPNLPDHLLQPYYQDFDFPFQPVCRALWTSCSILPDGSVTPCLHVVAGNVTEQPLMELWNGPQYRQLRRIIVKRLFPACDRCCFRTFSAKRTN